MKYNIITEKNSLYESEGGDCLASIKEVAQKAGGIEGFKFYRVCIG